MLQFRIEATDAQSDQRRLHAIDEPALLADEGLAFPVRSLGVLSSSVGIATILQ
jgi:hypothetical protein